MPRHTAARLAAHTGPQRDTAQGATVTRHGTRRKGNTAASHCGTTSGDTVAPRQVAAQPQRQCGQQDTVARHPAA